MRKITLLCTLLFTLSTAFAQTTLGAGDIAFVGLNTDGATDADDNFAFILLKDIDAATQIIFTDRGWSDATGFSSYAGDGEFTWISGAARTAGEVIVLDFSNLSPPAASFTVAGDQLFAIQGSIASPTFITGLHFNVVTGVTDDTNWDGDATSNTTSALPDALTTGDTAVRLTGPGGVEQDNFQFSCGIAGCPLSGTPEQIRAIVHNLANWVSNDDTVYPGTVDASLGTVTITDGETPPTINDITFNQSGYCPGELIVITIDGQLNDATEWVVYNGSGCGVTEIVRSSSSTINIGSRANVDTYNVFVRGEGGTIATPPDCFETSIIVGGTNPEITSLSLNQSTYLPGETVILSVNGSLNDATEWVVYNDDGCGVTEVVRSSSSTINVGFRALAGLYTLYVRGEGDCVEEITCTTIDIIVNEPKPTPIITEIMYNPSSMEDDWEWIEIYNPGSVDLDISGYVIDDFNSVAHSSANIATGIVPAGESVVLYNSEDVSEADFLAAWGFVNLVPVTNWGAMSLNNTGDTIGIWDSFASYSGDNETQANVIEQVAYETTDWPLDDGISSVYLKDLTADNTIGSNWALSTDGGATPLFEGYTSQAAGGNNGGDIGSPGTPFTLASITVLKNVDDDSFADMMFDFSFGGIPFSISENTTEGYVFENLLPGNYEITELVPDGWDLVSINAGAGNNNTALPNGLKVVLEAGENAVVTFNNVYVPIPAIVINEILADPPADLLGDANGDGTRDASQDEFIEIVNLEDSDVDISGWTISDGVAIRHTFPANTILASNCGAVIFGGGTPTGQFGGMAVQTASSGLLGFNNGGDTVILSDDEANVIATYTYGSEGGNDQSLTLDPDGTGTEPLVPHSTATGSGGTPFSPGTRVDGTAFVGCEVIAPPVIGCPLDITIDYNASTDPSNTGGASYFGGAGDVDVTWSDVLAPNGTITRTWTATDDFGGSSSCTQTITVSPECKTPVLVIETVDNNAGTITLLFSGEDPTGLVTINFTALNNLVVLDSDGFTSGGGNTWSAPDPNPLIATIVLGIVDANNPTFNYSVNVTNGCGETGIIDGQSCQVSIETQPQDVDVTLCETNPLGIFTVEASGSGALSYVWEEKISTSCCTWSDMGINANILEIATEDLANKNGSTFRVTVTSDNGTPGDATDDCSVTSDEVTLTTVSLEFKADIPVNFGVQTDQGGGLPAQGTQVGDKGVYSGPGVTDDGNGLTYTFDPAVAGEGITTITYTYTNANGCSSSATDEILIFPEKALISINDVTQVEGTGGTTNFVFQVSLSRPSSETLIVDYETYDNFAISPDDFTAVSGTLTFNPGETSKDIIINVVPDLEVESDETFLVQIFGRNSGDFWTSKFRGTGTILNDDVICELSCSIEQGALTTDHLTEDGIATVTPYGGTAPFTYLWDNGEKTQTATKLTYGMHSVTVTDANGCQTTCEIDIAKELYCWINLIQNVSEYGGKDGAARVSGNGGYRPFTFKWDDGSTEQTNNSLTAGIHYVTITDAKGATSQCSITIMEPTGSACDKFTSDVEQVKLTTDHLTEDGVATVTPYGGTAPYTYYWDNGETTQTATTLTYGMHSVTVTDANGCESISYIDITKELYCWINLYGNVTVHGGSDGSAKVHGNGGYRPFTYRWDDGTTDQLNTNLKAGTHYVTITDATGATSRCSITITEPGQEICDGVDNDGDGDIDEGFDKDGDGTADCFDECDDSIDTDQDGVPDCRDACPGFDDTLDSDGDGTADCYDDCDDTIDTDQDGVPDCKDICPGFDDTMDSDGDGTPDGCDIEVCDGVDNDGDGEIDEGFDKDGDGTADCYDDCDDTIDTDQDGVPDCRDVCPGFDDTMDSDGDGTPDGCDIEVCDGVDNDGDGDIDEGFDQDGDGTADCFDECDDSIDTDQDGVPDCTDICPGGDDNLDTDGDGTPDFCDDCDDLDDDGDGVRNCEDVCPGGDDMADSDGDGIPDSCDEEVCDGVDNDGDGDIDEGLNCDPGSIDQCETAFARSSDENVRTCFLNIPNINGNRWGWTNEFPSIDGVYEMDLYAAAGQCDISKGALVGSVQVVYSGGSVSVTVSTLGGYKMTEAQLYVGRQ